MEMVRMFTAEAVAGEIVRIREFIDAELRGAIDKAFDRLSDRIIAASAGRQAVPESPASVGKGSEASDQTSQESELPDALDTQDAPDEIRLNARQRRAVKRARKMQKPTS
jgi:hypothetical protein